VSTSVSRKAAPVTIPADARRGRAFVCGVIIVNTLGLLSAITLAAATEDHGRLLRHLFSLLVNSGLMYGLWRGIRWVKWLFAFGMLLSGLLLLYFPVRFPGSAFTLITVPFAVLLLWASCVCTNRQSVFPIPTRRSDRRLAGNGPLS